ncbi:hypothetical protein STEG23_006562 [Scotinomys teguina]
MTKLFTLHVDEHQGVEKGVVTQKLGPWKRPVAYFSKKLDNVATDWPPCLRTIAAVAVLVNVKRLNLSEGTRAGEERPGTNWEIDFTEIKPGKYGNKCLLVFVDNFCRWTEAFPTKREIAQIVVKKILEDIFPRFGLPKVIGSDNGRPCLRLQAHHGLTPDEILYGGPPPMADLLNPVIASLADTPNLQARLRALQIIKDQVRKPLATA